MRLLTTLAVLTAFVAAPALAIDFDQAVDVSAVVDSLKTSAVESPEAPEAKDVRPLFRREERDCVRFAMSADGPTRSETVVLRSAIYRERCWHVPDRPRRDRDGRGRRGGGRRPRALGADEAVVETVESGEKRRECREEWVRTERRQINLEVTGRGEMLPWERDVFQVCLQGDWLTANTIDASHKFDIDVPRWGGGTIMATAMHKVQSEPDRNGVRALSFTFDKSKGNFVLELGDKWAEYYAGEKLGLELVLKRHRKNWFDGTALDTELVVDVADTIEIDFSTLIDRLEGDLDPGKKYYVKWKFRRLGSTSKDSWQKKGETGKATWEGDQIDAKIAPTGLEARLR